MTRILVLGAGVIGSVYALRFAKAGYSVSVLARGERLSNIRARGLALRHAMIGDEERAEVEALETPATARIGGPVLVVGNNLGDYEAQSRLIGADRFVLGFGAFGGYRERGSVVYIIDRRTKEKPAFERLNGTTIGVLSDSARPALERARTIFHDAALPVKESAGISAWLVCHAALVFPLAGAIHAVGGDQQRLCRTRDAIVLGARAAKELLHALRALGMGLALGSACSATPRRRGAAARSEARLRSSTLERAGRACPCPRGTVSFPFSRRAAPSSRSEMARGRSGLGS